MCPSTCGFDDFGFCVDQVVFDKVQARLDVSILKLDKVQACSDLLLYGYFIQLVTGCLLRHRRGNNSGTVSTWFILSRQQLLLVVQAQKGIAGYRDRKL